MPRAFRVGGVPVVVADNGQDVTGASSEPMRRAARVLSGFVARQTHEIRAAEVRERPPEEWPFPPGVSINRR